MASKHHQSAQIIAREGSATRRYCPTPAVLATTDQDQDQWRPLVPTTLWRCVLCPPGWQRLGVWVEGVLCLGDPAPLLAPALWPEAGGWLWTVLVLEVWATCEACEAWKVWVVWASWGWQVLEASRCKCCCPLSP